MVRPNQLSFESGAWLKRRRWWAAPIIAAGNVVMWLGGQPIYTAITLRGCARWEQEGYDALHAGVASAKRLARGAIRLEALPGEALRAPPSRAQLRAAARELARAHRCYINGLAFTHGDPHLGNFVFSDTRAYLLDFETRHLSVLSHQARQLDDLHVMALDLAGRAPDLATLLDWFDAMLEGYALGDELRRALSSKLGHEPWCFERLFISSRAHELPWGQLHPRLKAMSVRLQIA